MRSEAELIALLKNAENPDLHPNMASYTRDRVITEVLLDVRSLLSEISSKLDKKGK